MKVNLTKSLLNAFWNENFQLRWEHWCGSLEKEGGYYANVQISLVDKQPRGVCSRKRCLLRNTHIIIIWLRRKLDVAVVEIIILAPAAEGCKQHIIMRASTEQLHILPISPAALAPRHYLCSSENSLDCALAGEARRQLTLYMCVCVPADCLPVWHISLYLKEQPHTR